MQKAAAFQEEIAAAGPTNQLQLYNWPCKGCPGLILFATAARLTVLLYHFVPQRTLTSKIKLLTVFFFTICAHCELSWVLIPSLN